MPRTPKEWIGRTDDSKPPASVRQRRYDLFKGICQLTGLPIAGKPWDLHHKTPLWKGGANRESNLVPVLRSAHQKLSAEDKAQKAKEDRKRQAHIGARPAPSRPLRSRGFAKKARPVKLPLPPRRALYGKGRNAG